VKNSKKIKLIYLQVKQDFTEMNNKPPIPVAARLLGLRVRIPPGAWMSVSCEFCVLSGRGLCVGSD
jgi:hypothetical protein